MKNYFIVVVVVLIALVIGCSKVKNWSAEPDILVLLRLHNEIRFQRGLGDLQIEETLQQAAQKHAEWMANNQNLSHTGARGSSVGDRIGGGWGSLGENIACGQETEEEVMEDWMKSRGHRENVLTKEYNDVGIGIARSKNGRLYWCVDFGRKLR